MGDRMTDLIGRYYFAKKGKSIIFVPFAGTPIQCVRHSNNKPISLTKIASGLNHFIEFFRIHDYDMYLKLYEYLFSKIITMYNDANILSMNMGANFSQLFIQTIEKHVQFDDWFLERVIDYVVSITVDNINDDEANTEVTLTNVDIRILHCLTVLVKMGYIINGVLNNSNSKTEDNYLQFMDNIMVDVIQVYLRKYPQIWNEERQTNLEVGKDYDEIQSEIHLFFSEFYSNKWNKENTENFRLKFAEFGMTPQKLADEARIIMWKAFRKYVPPIANPKDETLIPRYGLRSENDIKDIIYNIECKWSDFQFVNKNMSKFITTVYTNIIKKQDTKRNTPSVNMPEIILDSYSDTSSKKDTLLYTDKTSFLYNTRVQHANEVMGQFTDGLAEIYQYLLETEGEDTAEAMVQFTKKSLNLEEDHTLNTIILNRCLLAIFGEYKTYSQLIFGSSNRNILALFYFRILLNDEFDYLRGIIQAMSMTDTGILASNIDYDTMETLMGVEHVFDARREDLETLLHIYTGTGRAPYTPTIYEVWDILTLLHNPDVLRNLLFPKLYPLEYSDEPEEEPFREYRERDHVVDTFFEKFITKRNERRK